MIAVTDCDSTHGCRIAIRLFRSGEVSESDNSGLTGTCWGGWTPRRPLAASAVFAAQAVVVVVQPVFVVPDDLHQPDVVRAVA